MIQMGLRGLKHEVLLKLLSRKNANRQWIIENVSPKTQIEYEHSICVFGIVLLLTYTTVTAFEKSFKGWLARMKKKAYLVFYKLLEALTELLAYRFPMYYME